MGVLFVFGFVMAVWIGFFCLFLRASAPEQPPSIQQENKNAECKKIQQQSNYGFKIITNLLTSLEDNAAKGLDSNLQDSNAPYAFHSQELLKNYLSPFLLAYFFFPISRGLF